MNRPRRKINTIAANVLFDTIGKGGVCSSGWFDCSGFAACASDAGCAKCVEGEVGTR